MHVFNADGTEKDMIEIVDVKNKKSMGLFTITERTQYIVNNPIDAENVKSIYKECFDISK